MSLPLALPTSLNILELLKDGHHFAELHGNNTHIINAITGVRYVMPTRQTTPLHFNEHVQPDGTTWYVAEGLSENHLESRDSIPYNPILVDVICQRIAEGGALTVILKEDDKLPTYAMFSRWRRAYPYIDEHMEKARRDRAEAMRDRAIEAAESADEDNVAAQSLKHNAYKWAAGVDDARFSPKAKVEATLTVPTQIIVHTGIDRSPEREVHGAPEEVKELAQVPEQDPIPGEG